MEGMIKGLIEIVDLWKPILLSSVIVFIASSLIHMLLSFWHKGDFKQTPNEDRLMDAVRPLSIPPGDYCVPRPSNMAEMRTPEFAQKINKGPVMFFTMLPNGPMNTGQSLA